MGETQYPFQQFGIRLKQLRQKAHESMAEVSGAVEIDNELLAKIEQGRELPSEEILLLLISHFDVPEDEAVKLWELAGYSKQDESQKSNNTKEQQMNFKQMVMIMPVDNRIMYTDTVNVAVNDAGVVMNFMQNQGDGQVLPIARVGMSKEHAKNVLELLRQTIEAAEQPKVPRALPNPQDNKKAA